MVKRDNEESIIKYIVSQKIWNVLLECSIIHITVTCPNLCQNSYYGNLFSAVCLFFFCTRDSRISVRTGIFMHMSVIMPSACLTSDEDMGISFGFCLDICGVV